MKDTVKDVKRQATGWEKIFANHIFNKRLESRVDKELKKQQICFTLMLHVHGDW